MKKVLILFLVIVLLSGCTEQPQLEEICIDEIIDTEFICEGVSGCIKIYTLANGKKVNTLDMRYRTWVNEELELCTFKKIN